METFMYYAIINQILAAARTKRLPTNLGENIMLNVLRVIVDNTLKTLGAINGNETRKKIAQFGSADRALQHVREAVYRTRDNQNRRNRTIFSISEGTVLQTQAGIE